MPQTPAPTLHTSPYGATHHHPLSLMLLLQQAHNIFCLQPHPRCRPRRSTAAMAHDPITLVVVLSEQGKAVGELYVDDGMSFAFQRVGGTACCACLIYVSGACAPAAAGLVGCM